MLLLVLILVLIAFGLLVVALLTETALFAWVSVAISVVAAVVLVIDWIRRRAAIRSGDPQLEPEAAPAPVLVPARPSVSLPDDPVTEQLPAVSADRAPDVADTLLMAPAVAPSGSAGRPPGAQTAATRSGDNSAPAVTDADRAGPSRDTGSGNEPADAQLAEQDRAAGTGPAERERTEPDTSSDAPPAQAGAAQEGAIAPSEPAGDEQPEHTAVEPEPEPAAEADPEPEPAEPEPAAEADPEPEPAEPEPAAADGSERQPAAQAGSTSEPAGAVSVADPRPADPEPADPGLSDSEPPGPNAAGTGEKSTGEKGENSTGETSTAATAAAADPAPAGIFEAVDDRTMVLPAVKNAEPPEEPRDPSNAALVAGLPDEVAVIDERPRYHLTVCRFLPGKTLIRLPVREAVELGFTPCGWCNPDRTLSGRHRATSSR